MANRKRTQGRSEAGHASGRTKGTTARQRAAAGGTRHRSAPRLNTAQVQGLFQPSGPIAGAGGLGGSGGAGLGQAGGADASGLGFSELFNRMGGLDGILSTMGKVQKVMSIVKQMSPVFKMIGGFGLGAGAAAGAAGSAGGAKVSAVARRRPAKQRAAAADRTLGQSAKAVRTRSARAASSPTRRKSR